MRNYCYCLVLFALFFGFQSPCSASELTEICQQASLLPGRIRSYQFSARMEMTFSSGKKTDIVKFWQSGDNIRVESKMVVPPGKKVDPMGAGGAIYAYNGSLYQWAIPGREALSFSKQCRHPNLYWGANPILVPYSWLATGVVNWSDLKDRERWLAQFDKARYEGKKTENNKIFDVVSFPYTPNDENPFAIEQIHVYFSKETGYYPLKSVYYAKNKQLLGHVEVLQYTLLDIDGQKTVFPLVVTGENSKFTITIDESSIKVNQHIDEDLFTLSPSMAKDVYDYDEELKKLEPFSDTSDVVNTSGNTVPPSRWTWKRISIIVIADVIIIAILLILWYWLRKKK